MIPQSQLHKADQHFISETISEGQHMISRSISELPMIRRTGRTTETEGKLNLFWTASGVDFCFSGYEISASFTTDYSIYEQWIAVEMDGFFLLRMPLKKGTSTIPLFRSLNPDSIHRIRIFKEVQIVPDDPDHFLSLDSLSFDGQISAPPEADLKIEFIGDSITCGYGDCGSPLEEDFISPYSSIENSYTRMVADQLNATFSCISVDGWGILSDYRNNPDCALPLYYENVCGATCSGKNILARAYDSYDFEADPSDVVVINLGTNDDWAFRCGEPYIDPETAHIFCQKLDEFGHPDMDSLTRFEDAVISFLRKVRSFNPAAQIIWCYGMLGSFLAHEIAEAVARYQMESGDRMVHYLLLPGASTEELGACGHPGKPAHKQTASILTSYLRHLHI